MSNSILVELGGGQILLINVLMRIVLPSILFAAIEFFPSSLMQGRGIDMVNFAYKTIGGGTYWFTSALAVSEIIELFLLTTRIKNIWFYFLTSLVIGLMGMSYQNGMYRQEFWAWHRGIIAVMFLGFGGLYWRYENVISKYFRRCYITTGLMVLYTAILLCCKNTNPNISILSLQPLGIVTTLFACVLLIELCKVLPENRIVNYIGQNTLGFYFMSGALPIVVSMLAHKLISGSYLVVMLADWIICLILAYAFVKLINRWLPWMFDFKKMNLKNKQL